MVICRTYDQHLEGEVVLYKHTSLPYAVHTYQRVCNDGVTCNCAVAIRSGDDVLVVDRCGVQKNDLSEVMSLSLYLNGELTPGTRIYKLSGGREFMVCVMLHLFYTSIQYVFYLAAICQVNCIFYGYSIHICPGRV